MVLTDPDEIVERISTRSERQIDLKDVFNKRDLQNEIESTYSKDGRRDRLTDNIKELFGTSTTSESVKDTAIDKIERSTDLRDLEVNFDRISGELDDIGRSNELKVQQSYFEKSNELILDKGFRITRGEIEEADLDALKSVKRFASRLNISKDSARQVLVREGFELYDEDRRFK